MPRISAACNQLRAPLKARKMTSCRFIARSTAAVSQSIGTSLVTDVSTALRPKSGHFTCSRERTDHELPTISEIPVDIDWVTLLGSPACPKRDFDPLRTVLVIRAGRQLSAGSLQREPREVMPATDGHD